jgi:hypothetical protein
LLGVSPAGYFQASGLPLGEVRFSKSRIEKTPPECSLELDRKTPKEASRTQTIKNGLLRLAESEKSAFDGGELPMKRERRLEIDSRRGF